MHGYMQEFPQQTPWSRREKSLDSMAVCLKRLDIERMFMYY